MLLFVLRPFEKHHYFPHNPVYGHPEEFLNHSQASILISLNDHCTFG